jgi:hypothetical protein
MPHFVCLLLAFVSLVTAQTQKTPTHTDMPRSKYSQWQANESSPQQATGYRIRRISTF